MKFTHLHTHSHYSLLDGLIKIDDLIERVKEYNMDSVALTDHGVMYGAIEFYQKAVKARVKPIVGVEAYLTDKSRFEKTRQNRFHLILLAKNKTGYSNLLKLTTLAHLEGYYYKPRIDWEILEKYNEGLIALSACVQGEIPRTFLNYGEDKAREVVKKYLKLFGTDFYLEIQRHDLVEGQEKANQGLIKIGKELGIPIVATNDAHYLDVSDEEAQDVLLCLQMKKKQKDKDRMNMIGMNNSFKSAEAMKESFYDFKEAVSNTEDVAKKCNLEIELGKIYLPKFEVPSQKTDEEYLRELCEKGLRKRYPKYFQDNVSEEKNIFRKKAEDRMDFELNVISKTGFASYFLIVQDFVNWSKKQKIVVGPGRGSAAGSLVAYLLSITNVDPLKYDLMFERFLNPDRISMPDIDLDFADTRRDEVIRYVEEKYGRDKVAQIITFGTMAARAAVRDVGRVLDYDYNYCDKLAKMIPMFTSLQKAITEVGELNSIYNNEADAKKILDTALKLEGVARHASTHACAVLITKDPLDKSVPLQYASSGDRTIVSQYPMKPVEALGLLKMDFLGLRNLTIIENALRIIKGLRDVEINIDNIPLDDKKTFELFSRGDTTGVFQFECLSGETIVSNTTIKKLYEKRNKKRLLSVYLDEGKVHKNEILNVIESGEKEVYTLIAENNWCIKATKKHKFLTEDGWKKLGDIKLGEKILIKKKAKHLIYNTCQNCGKQIDGQKDGKSKFCYRCSAYYYKNPSKKESREKIKEGREKFFENGGTVWNIGLNKDNSEKVKQIGKNISKALIGKTFEDLYGEEKAKEMKRKMSERYRGKGNPMFGKPSPHRKGGFRKDLGHYVHSSWEADFARILKFHNLDYEYEPKRFSLIKKNNKIMHYTPDFYVKSNNTFYEVKGWMHDLDAEKIRLFQEQHQEYNFVLIDKTKFAEFALKYKTLINWECPKIPNNFHFLKVKKIKYSGKEKTYDIAMRAPGNNFIANGFVVHNSSGMRRYLKLLEPTVFEDIIAMVALYRPGPLNSGMIDEFIDRKHGRKKITFKHPIMESALKNSYGVIVYQEQVMQLSKDMAGFTGGQADTLRKAMGKKIAALMAKMKSEFIEGCKKKGLEDGLARDTFRDMEKFAEYGFNRSHAACYGLIGYQTAYLKANYPIEFMAALLSSNKGDVDKIAVDVGECQKIGIEVLPPDINESFQHFTVVPPREGDEQKFGQIRFGLLTIKNVGQNIVEEIIKERKKNGSFLDLTDFISRIKSKDFNKKSLESLIKCGALDNIEKRNKLLFNLEKILIFIRTLRDQEKSKQGNLLGMLSDDYKLTLELDDIEDDKKVSQKEKLSWEKELLGLYVSDHPFTKFQGDLQGKIPSLLEISKNKDFPKDKVVIIAGVITKIQKIITKKGDAMLFVKIEDAGGNLEILVFPRLLEESKDLWEEEKIVIMKGKLSDKDGTVKLLVESARELVSGRIDEAISVLSQANNTNKFYYKKKIDNRENPVFQASHSKFVDIRIPKTISKESLFKLKEFFSKSKGNVKVRFIIENGVGTKIINTSFSVSPESVEGIKDKVNLIINESSL